MKLPPFVQLNREHIRGYLLHEDKNDHELLGNRECEANVQIPPRGGTKLQGLCDIVQYLLPPAGDWK